MAQRKTLTEAQVDLLRWVADGCADDVYEGTNHHISVAALQRRGLALTAGRGDAWTASVTGAGIAYLAEVDGPTPPVARRPNVSISDQLLADVEAAGGRLEVPTRTWGRGGVNWERRVEVAIERGKVPPGKELRFHWLRGDHDLITLTDVPEDMVPVSAAVPLPARVGRYHPVVREFRSDAKGLDVSKAALPRVSLILHALVTEAIARGYKVDYAGEHHLGFTADDHRVTLAVEEVGVRHRWVTKPDRDQPGDPYGIRHYKQVAVRDDSRATGRLVFEYVPPGRDRRRVTKWSDRRGSRIEDVLAEILAEVPVAAAEARHQRVEAERQAAIRRAEWEQAMDAARGRYVEQLCREELEQQMSRRDEALRIRSYAEALTAVHGSEPTTAAWVAWMHGRAAELDPLASPPSMPDPPEKVQPEDLRPYLKGRSPYGPEATH
jgi:hypothetical protein